MAPDLLAAIVAEHGAALALYARQWCHSPDDVVQGVFLKLARLGAAPANPAGWLYRSVRNAAIDAGRAERRRAKYEARAAAEVSPWFLADDGAAGIDARRAAEALAGLPAEFREVIVAHLWGGRTFEEIGTLAGSSAATCYRRYAAGLKQLRELLRAPDPEPAPARTRRG